MSRIGSEVSQVQSYQSLEGMQGRENRSMSIGDFNGRSVAQSESPRLSQQISSSLTEIRPLSEYVALRPANDDLEPLLNQNQIDHQELLEDLGLPENQGEVGPEDVKRFLKTHLDAAKALLQEKGINVEDNHQLNQLTQDIEDNPPEAEKKAIKQKSAEIREAVKNALPDTEHASVKTALIDKRQAVLSNQPEWREGYRTQVGNNPNVYQPLGTATCHHFTTNQPTNAWKTTIGEGTQKTAFYRNGTFAPQPSKLGEKWTNEQKQNIANQRAENMATAMVTDYIKSHPGKLQAGSENTFRFSNLNLMRQGLIVSEKSLNKVHASALNHLNGKTVTVNVDGKDYQVKLQTREWRQDIKDGPYFGNSREANRANDAAIRSLTQDIENLPLKNPDRQDMLDMANQINTQLQYQKRSGFNRLMRAAGRGIANLFGANMKNPIMDPSETSAMIINLESKLAKYQPGGISEGCKSGKDRGSLVDVSAKALSLEIAKNKAAGQPALEGIKSSWMRERAQNDENFRNDLGDLFTSNFKLQELNTGFKGYITRDIFSWAGHQNYMEDLAQISNVSVKGGSNFIKS